MIGEDAPQIVETEGFQDAADADQFHDAEGEEEKKDAALTTSMGELSVDP